MKETTGEPYPYWKDNIKIDLRETGYGGMEWIQLALNRDRWKVLSRL
jgi:hypothetical protein